MAVWEGRRGVISEGVSEAGKKEEEEEDEVGWWWLLCSVCVPDCLHGLKC